MQEEEETLLETFATPTYDEGIYTIGTALSSIRVLDVAGASTKNKANVQIYKPNDTNAQKFELVKNANGTVTFINVNSGKALDVYGGKKVSGTNVQQYTANGTAAQQWILKDAGDGYVAITSALGKNLTLDIKGARTSNKTNVWIYKYNGSAAQQFKLTPADVDAAVEKGTYTIETALAAGRVADIKGASTASSANCQLYKSNDTAAQKFRIEPKGKGIYTITNVNSKMALAVTSTGNVVQKAAKNVASQQWKILKAGGDYCRIVNVENGLTLDVRGGETKNGTNIRTYKSNGTNAQRFKLLPVSDPPHIVEIDPGHQLHGDSSLEPNAPGSSTMKAKVTTGTAGVSTRIDEYVTNLEVGLKLRDELVSRGYTVFMTRETHDVRISNVERAQKATADGAEIFVRIHANGSDDDNTWENGVLGYCPDDDNPWLSKEVIKESQRLSALLCNYQCKATGQQNLGLLKDNTMTGINWATMPVTIVEMGYMSNPEEDVYMNSASGQKTIVKALADGIDAYFAGETP